MNYLLQVGFKIELIESYSMNRSIKDIAEWNLKMFITDYREHELCYSDLELPYSMQRFFCENRVDLDVKQEYLRRYHTKLKLLICRWNPHLKSRIFTHNMKYFIDQLTYDL